MLYTEQHRELMRSVTKFAQSEIDPHADEWEKEGIFPAHELFKKMGKQDLLSPPASPPSGPRSMIQSRS
jgi:citronellyl-CoA dehydrogenase